MEARQHQFTVRRFTMLTPTVFELVFESDQELTFEAGQFISVIIPGAGPNGRDLRRAYSIASGPENKQIELCIKLVEGGPGTQYLYTLRPGDVFKGVAPYGDFTYVTPESKHACFISTGTGIAPFRSMILSKHLAEHFPKSLTCLLGVRGDDEILYNDEFKKLRWGSEKLNWVTAVTGHRVGADDKFRGNFMGRVTDYLRSLEGSYPWTEADFYLCGSGAMIEEIKTILMSHGVQKDAIHKESYYK